MEIAAFSLINKPFVWELNGCPISGLLMDAYVYPRLCTHTKQHRPLSSMLVKPMPGSRAVLPLPGPPILLHLGPAQWPPAHLASWKRTGSEQALSTHYLSLGSTVPSAHTHQGSLLFSPPSRKHCAALHMPPAITPRGVSRCFAVWSFPFRPVTRFTLPQPIFWGYNLPSASHLWTQLSGLLWCPSWSFLSDFSHQFLWSRGGSWDPAETSVAPPGVSTSEKN